MGIFQRYWYKLPLRSKLNLFFVPVILVIVFLTLYFTNISYRYINEFQSTLQTHYCINTFMLEIRKHESFLNRFINGEDIKVSDMQEVQKKLDALLEEMKVEKKGGDNAQFQIRAISNAYDEYIKKTYQTVMKYWDAGAYYQDFYQAQKIQNYIQQYLNLLQSTLFSEGNHYYLKIAKDADLLQKLMLVIIALVSIFLLRLVFLFAQRFTAPIKRLAELSSRIASGEFDVPPVSVPVPYGDEISVLSNTFNKMSRNIKNMVDDLKEQSVLEKKLHEEELEKETAQLALKESQLVSLQSQIQPHFLFNTLNTIRRQAELEDANQTAALIKSLSTLFRFNLLSHQQTVLLEQEVLAVNEYVSLQQKRFGNRIKYSFKSTIELDTVQIPPLVIMTFVENAICHGLEPKVDGGIVYLDIRMRNDNCLIRIMDTGIGMTQEEKQKMISFDEDSLVVGMDGSVHGVGIRNIFMRFKLLYLDKGKVTIYSKPNRGTLVAIEIPKKLMK